MYESWHYPLLSTLTMVRCAMPICIRNTSLTMGVNSLNKIMKRNKTLITKFNF